MGILAWIVLGLIAGAIAKAIMPGNDPGGIIVTMIIGIVGAFIGGFLGNLIAGVGLNGFSFQSIILAIIGALVLLWIYRMATKNRTTTRVP
jgi:Predicted membrane protein